MQTRIIVTLATQANGRNLDLLVRAINFLLGA